MVLPNLWIACWLGISMYVCIDFVTNKNNKLKQKLEECKRQYYQRWYAWPKKIPNGFCFCLTQKKLRNVFFTKTLCKFFRIHSKKSFFDFSHFFDFEQHNKKISVANFSNVVSLLVIMESYISNGLHSPERKVKVG